MANTAVEIMDDRRGWIDSQGIRHYVRKFRVRLDSYKGGPLEAVTTSGVPRYFDRYDITSERDDGAIAREISADLPSADDPSVWVVTVNYSNEPLSFSPNRFKESAPGGFSGLEGSSGGSGGRQQGGSAEERDPLKRPAIWKISGTRFSIPVQADIYGRAIVNSAGMRYSPAPEMDVPGYVISGEFNVGSFDHRKLAKARFKLNRESVFGFPPRYVRFSNFEAEDRVEQVKYASVRVEFEAMEDPPWLEKIVQAQGDRGRWINTFSPWDIVLLDQGMHIMANNGDWDAVLDRHGKPVNEPVPLNGKGTDVLPNQEDPVYLKYEIYDDIPFRDLFSQIP